MTENKVKKELQIRKMPKHAKLKGKWLCISFDRILCRPIAKFNNEESIDIFLKNIKELTNEPIRIFKY